MTELAGDNADKYCATNRWFEPGNAVRRYRLLLLTALAILLGEAAGAARYDAHERTGLPGGIDPVAAATHASRLHKPRRVAAGEGGKIFAQAGRLPGTQTVVRKPVPWPGAPVPLHNLPLPPNGGVRISVCPACFKKKTKKTTSQST